MLVDLKTILGLAEQKHCAIPAFNVYNMETVMGVARAAEAAKAPAIFQVYSRLFENGEAMYLAPTILRAIETLSVPAAFHLDHGAGDGIVQKALRLGATGIMRDASALPFAQNVEETRRVVQMCAPGGGDSSRNPSMAPDFSNQRRRLGVPVEGELGHIGSAADETMGEYTDPAEAKAYVEQTGVAALAILVGTAHGRYRQAPVLDIERIGAIKAATGVPLVLHGGSGVPDDQIRAAIGAGIRKINFGTDVCYAFLDAVFQTSRDLVAVDLFMKEAVGRVKEFALSKIALLGAGGGCA